MLKVHPELLCVLVLPLSIEYGLFHSLLIFTLFFIKLGCLVSNSIYLTIQNKLLPNHIQLLLFQILLVLFVNPSHFHVLAFQQLYMLMGTFFIVEEATNPTLLLILHNFFLQNFELEIHEMHLLLEVADEFVFNTLIWILTKCLVHKLILPSKLHICRLIAWVIEDLGAGHGSANCTFLAFTE